MRAHSRRLRASLQCFIFSTVAVAAGCTAPHKLISARHTSCPPRKLEIRELIMAGDREDWIAVCGAQRFACSTREQGRRLVYACKPLTAASDAGVLEDAGDAR